jgi:hypothetical protein
MNRNPVLRIAAITTCVAALGLGTATAASASVRPDLLCKTQFIVNGARIHASASLSSTVVGLGYEGQWFYAQDFVYGSGGVDFLYGTDNATGVTGFVDAGAGLLNQNECP